MANRAEHYGHGLRVTGVADELPVALSFRRSARRKQTLKAAALVAAWEIRQRPLPRNVTDRIRP